MLDILQYLLYLQQQVFTEFKNNNVMYLYDNWVNISKFPWELLKSSAWLLFSNKTFTYIISVMTSSNRQRIIY